MAIDYDTQMYKLPEVARASGWAVPTLKSYFRRGKVRIIGKRRDGTDDDGVPPLFSLRDALMLAVANRTWRCGFPIEAAFNVGASFAHTGDMPNNRPHRMPGKLVPGRRTILVLHPMTGFHEFVGLSYDTLADDFPTLFWSHQYGQTDASTIVMLPEVEHAVFTALRVDWREHDSAEAMLVNVMTTDAATPIGED